MKSKNAVNRSKTNVLCLRMSDEFEELLTKLTQRTKKTRTRIIEEALYLHAKGLR